MVRLEREATPVASPTGCERRNGDRRASDRALPRRVLMQRLHATGLSPRELQIAWLAICGFSNRQIAERCHICEQTVKDHLKHVYNKLRVRSRAGVVAKVLGLGEEAHRAEERRKG